MTEKIWGSRVLDLFAGDRQSGDRGAQPGRGDVRLRQTARRESLRLMKENIAHCRAEEGARRG